MPFGWDESTGRYRYPSGKLVPRSVVDRGLERVIRIGALNMRSVSEDLQTGAITLAEWQTRMAGEMKLLHVGAAALGRGGWRQMDFTDWGWTGRKIRDQYAFLRSFAQDIATGVQPMDGRLLTRAALYAGAVRGTQRAMEHRQAQLRGHREERNRLGAADRHCAQCVDCSAQGWVPMGTLPAPGTRSCLSNCKCRLETRDVRMAA